MVASDAMSQRQKPFVQRSACEQLSLFTAKDQKKKLQQIPSFVLIEKDLQKSMQCERFKDF